MRFFFCSEKKTIADVVAVKMTLYLSYDNDKPSQLNWHHIIPVPCDWCDFNWTTYQLWNENGICWTATTQMWMILRDLHKQLIRKQMKDKLFFAHRLSLLAINLRFFLVLSSNICVRVFQIPFEFLKRFPVQNLPTANKIDCHDWCCEFIGFCGGKQNARDHVVIWVSFGYVILSPFVSINSSSND